MAAELVFVTGGTGCIGRPLIDAQTRKNGYDLRHEVNRGTNGSVTDMA
jgi:nucleoside-diphosphate-sugar epimerase